MVGKLLIEGVNPPRILARCFTNNNGTQYLHVTVVLIITLQLILLSVTVSDTLLIWFHRGRDRNWKRYQLLTRHRHHPFRVLHTWVEAPEGSFSGSTKIETKPSQDVFTYESSILTTAWNCLVWDNRIFIQNFRVEFFSWIMTSHLQL